MKKFLGLYLRARLELVVLLILTSSSIATGTDKDRFSLNGTWNLIFKNGSKTKIQVPKFWNAPPSPVYVDQARYQRTITIPKTWSGKAILLHFEGINHIAEVSIGNKIVGKHVGGWIPFTFEITPYVTPGKSSKLNVDVWGGNHSPIVDANGIPAWPVGWFGHVGFAESQDGDTGYGGWGMGFDVSLSARGKVRVEDVFVQPSVRLGLLNLTYTLTNTDSVSHTVKVQASAIRNEKAEVSLDTAPVRLAAGEKNHVIQAQIPWTTASLWSPDHPVLYSLNSKIIEGGSVLDESSQTFGFREVWVQGNQFMLNGVPTTLMGDTIGDHAQGFASQDFLQFLSRPAWPATIQRLKQANIGFVRFHMEPAPTYALDTADKAGLLIVDESPVYWRKYLEGFNKTVYLQNSKTWIQAWVRSRRNHPSIIRWSAENEMVLFGLLDSSDIVNLGDAIRAVDPTRPVSYDGDPNSGDDVAVVHYPEGYQVFPVGSIYQWKVPANQAMGVGEFAFPVYSNGKADRDYFWWQGTLTRGFRFTGFSDIRPYDLGWLWKVSLNPDPFSRYVSNSLAPIAIFDLNYDDDPTVRPPHYGMPSLIQGTVVSRDFVLYNDTTDTRDLTAQVDLLAEGNLIARNSQVYTLPPGDRAVMNYRLSIPVVEADQIQMVLRVLDRGSVQFEEIKPFRIH